MALTINHNLMAMNTARNLGTAYGGMATSVQRLSSGLRVGTAADDAAGLAIRELMRADIKAINQGIRNANDAISMIQVADGALGVIDEKLIRMKELAMQASTGTYSADQRLMINDEFQAMKSEIDRIARSTDFNGVKLLDGALSHVNPTAVTANLVVHLGYENSIADLTPYGNDAHWHRPGGMVGWDYYETGVVGESVYFNKPDHRAPMYINNSSSLNFSDQFTIETYVNFDNWTPSAGSWNGDFIVSSWGASEGKYRLRLENSGGSTNLQFQIANTNGASAAYDLLSTPYDFSLDSWYHIAATFEEGAMKLFVNGEKVAEKVSTITSVTTDPIGNPIGIGGEAFIAAANYNMTGNLDETKIYDGVLSESQIKSQYLRTSDGGYDVNVDKSTLVHFGSGNNSAEDYYSVNIGSVTSAALGIAQTQIDTQSRAQQALSQVDKAIVIKDKVRANLGAMQNRLENTITNLSIQAENLQASESRISDADVSQEMTEFVREQILAQSATAMLAQANSFPKMALQLIQG